MKHNTNNKGFTLIELLVVMSIIALLLSILMPALGRARAEAMLTKDSTQVKAINTGFNMWTPSHNGRFPTPGLEARDSNSGTFYRGRGPEALIDNNHQNMLSMCIMQNLFDSDIVIAPTEQGEFVFAIEGYNYNIYDPTPPSSQENWSLWDKDFVNNLESGSNNSYGIMPLTGKRKQQNWCVSTNSPTTFAVIGTRGPEEGEADKYSKSNLFHGIESDWKGTISFNDGHNEILETFHPIATTYLDTGGSPLADNIFLEETDQAVDDDYMPNGITGGEGADVFLTHVDEVGDLGKGGNVTNFTHD